jgi:hypothetical protein
MTLAALMLADINLSLPNVLWWLVVGVIAGFLASRVMRGGANPNANGGKLLVDLVLPAFTEYAIDVPKPMCSASICVDFMKRAQRRHH